MWRRSQVGAGRVVIGRAEAPPLPSEVAALVDEQRQRNAAQDDRIQARRLLHIRRDVVEGLATFLLVNLALAASWSDLLMIVAAGAVVGLFWGVTRSAGPLSGAVAAVVQVVLCATRVTAHSGLAANGWLYGALFGSACVALIAGFLGTRRQQRDFE